MTAVAGPRAPASYTGTQIVLHWVVAALVFFQLVFGESLPALGRIVRDGQTPTATEVLMADLHIYVGVAILLLVAGRLALRIGHGAPAYPEGGHPLAARLAGLTHWLFYALLVAMPVTGLVAYYLYKPLGEIHEAGKPVFILLIVVHVAAALYHRFVLRDDVMARMMRPGR